MKNLLWHSNAPWSPTGYGTQTALWVPLLKQAGYNAGISSFFGLEGNVLPWNKMPVYPGFSPSDYGNTTTPHHARVHFDGNLRDGLVVTLMDIWVLDPEVWSQMNTVFWTPVDHSPLPPPIREVIEVSTGVPMAMSRFGERMMREAGLDPLYCPHAIDTEAYAPQDKAEARERLNVSQDAFLVGMVAANKGRPSRKNFMEAFSAFAALRKRHPDALLFVHSEITGLFDGVNLSHVMEAVGLPSEAVLFPDQYRIVHYPFDDAHMARSYSAMDVLLMPSSGEGFGIPAIEAQACGVPVIVSDFSAQPELCGSGWLVDGELGPWTKLEAWQFRPHIADIYDALESAYNLSDLERDRHAVKAREFAEQYEIRVVLEEHMLPALEAARQRFEVRQPTEVKA